MSRTIAVRPDPKLDSAIELLKKKYYTTRAGVLKIAVQKLIESDPQISAALEDENNGQTK